MKLRNALTLVFISSAGLLAAQTDTFRLDSYKARYERRPAMSLNAQASFRGAYGNYREANNFGSGSARLFWQELRNTNDLISSWFLSGDLQGSFGQPTSLSAQSYNAGYLNMALQRERTHYYRENRFWGWGGALNANGGLISLDNSRSLNLILSPTVFRGWGRIEFAEDALLAYWMLEDLQDAGVISSFTPDDITALARTITDIIGNRTFDFRRRRIYELDQLQNTVREAGLVGQESFPLFAILNDNWAFANRSALPHGKRLAYGLEGTVSPQWGRSNDPFDFSTIFYTYGMGFAEFSSARIHNNRGGGQWTARIGGGYYFARRKFEEQAWQPAREDPFAQASLGYTYRWLPSSRTALNWANELEATSGLPNVLNPFVFSANEKQASWNSTLELNYFISYQWSFRLRAGGNLFYRDLQQRISFNPELFFSTNYFFF
ncbi:MAG: hypothetical protein KDD06_07525 [Phaeodactylibacter sp.]|nr:hypothetical protein [Phaeodactylibacter sp.]MCB9290056.1 hypothetical protein [Lewinellaceae bacterium]